MLARLIRPALHSSLFVAAAALAFSWSVVAAFSSQQSSLADEPSVEAALATANAAWNRGDRTVARAEFERVLEAAHRLELTDVEADAECGLGEVLFALATYPSSREHGLKALALYERLSSTRGVGRANHLLARTAEIMGDFAEAKSRVLRALEIFEAENDRLRRGRATMTLERVGGLKRDQRIRLFERTIDDARAVSERALEAEALHSWGDQLFFDAQYEQALAKLEQAAAVYQAIDDSASLGTVYNSVGRLYRAHGRLDEALKFQLKALEVHERRGAPMTLVQSLNAVATVYGFIGDLSNARTYYDRALALAERFGSPRVQDFLRANVANLQLQQGDFAAGAVALERVIANQRDVFVVERNATLAYAYLKLGRAEDALTAAHRSVEACAEDLRRCASALDRRAAVYVALHRYPEALADVEKALGHIETIRSNLVPADLFKQDFQRQVEDVYSAAIALHFGQHQERGALEAAELARSRAFLDLLASRDATLTPAAAAEPSAQDDLKEPASKAVDTIDPGLTFRGTGQRGRDGINATDLTSGVNSAPARTDDLVAIAARLKSTLVIYWTGEDELFTWVVRADGNVTARRVPVLRARLRELVAATASFAATSAAASPAPVNTITTRGATGINVGLERERAWRDLYDILIAPVHNLLPRATGSLLTIVPQGPLLNLSFAALRDKRGRYLLEDYTLHYVPAGGLLQFTSSRRSAASRRGQLLLIADPTLPALSRLEPKLPRLPGARTEVRAIAQLVPRSRVTSLESSVATESRVRADVSEKTVIHFATHAIVRDEDPATSYLVLARDRGEEQSDGILTAQEIYHLKLNADLVVLSACRSAGGRITGDGIATFARAFIYAGTPSLVASLWDVADEPVNRLIPGFYRSWFAGASKARSLRAAQLRFLRELRAGTVRVPSRAGVIVLPEDPLFWAGFVVIGEPE
jgi:CHAT domain-containing protein/tetratricopeptide (TPR) repeat protein